MEQRTGIRSSEFYLSLAAIILGAIMASGILSETATPWDEKVIGLLVSVLAALGYTASRTFVKAAEAKKEAIIAAAGAPKPNP